VTPLFRRTSALIGDGYQILNHIGRTTMDIRTLQGRLRSRGYDVGPIDGLWGPRTRKAVLAVMTDGGDNLISDADIADAAAELGCTPAHVLAVREVEASGQPFSEGRPTILFEPHRFSRATAGRFDRSHPAVSYRSSGDRPYPRAQAARYDQLLTAIGLDVDAGFSSASYGAFQILGENWKVCGYESPYAFAVAQAQSEGDQLAAFVGFVKGNGLARALAAGDWAAFARRYNGPAFAKNRYDERLASAFAKFSRKAAA
jgi:hypothetical protein